MQGLRTVIYKVSNLKDAKTWYSKAFDTKPYFDEPFYVGFSIGGYELGLMPDESNEEENSAKSSNISVYWGVEEIQKEFDRLIELRAEASEKPENLGGEIKVATVKDPWGNLLGIIDNPHFKLD